MSIKSLNASQCFTMLTKKKSIIFLLKKLYLFIIQNLIIGTLIFFLTISRVDETLDKSVFHIFIFKSCSLDFTFYYFPGKMYMMYYMNEEGSRVYTLKKVSVQSLYLPVFRIRFILMRIRFRE